MRLTSTHSSNKPGLLRKGLGRGLDALIPPSRMDPAEGISSKPVADFMNLLVSQLDPSKNQPRQEFNKASLVNLAESLKKHGVLQPLIVRQTEGEKYKIIAGERRWRAAKMAGLKKVPCFISHVDSHEELAVALVENLQREDLNPMEEAEGYRRLTEEVGYTQEQIAKAVGKDRTTITNALRLLRLPSAVQNLVTEKKVSMGHARALLALKDESSLLKLANQIALEGMSVRQTEQWTRDHSKSKEKERATPAKLVKKIAAKTAIEMGQEREIRRKLEQLFATRVWLEQKKGKGTLTIHFSDYQQLNDLLKKLGIVL